LSRQSGALDRSGVDEEHVVVEPRGLRREDADKPLDIVSARRALRLWKPGLLGQFGEEVSEVLAGDGEEATIRGRYR